LIKCALFTGHGGVKGGRCRVLLCLFFKTANQAAIGKLTEAQRRRLKLYYCEGLKYREIAVIENVRHASVNSSLRGALKKLRKQKKINQFRE